MDKKPVIIDEKLKIGISACAFGCPVRYNAKSIDVTRNLGREKSDFIWIPVCPETMAGLGVPRNPIHVIGKDGGDVWSGAGKVVNRNHEDVTDQVKEGAEMCMTTLKRAECDAYIFMDGSPTCGVYRTTLKRHKRGNPPGVFGALLEAEGLFLIPASDLQSPLKWWDWRRRLFAFTWLKSREIHKKSDLYDTWYKLKFICQELDEPWARHLGHEMAQIKSPEFDDFVERFKKEALEVLRKPSTVEKITNRLWKHYSHYKKVTHQELEIINEPQFRRNITSISKELIAMEIASVNSEILFGNTPVIYRGGR